MDRREIKDRLIDMGFYVSHKGFEYIVDVLESIDKEGRDIKITNTYNEITKRRKAHSTSVERCIRHDIECYYRDCKEPHRLLVNRVNDGKFASREFLFRLYSIIYNKEI